MPVELVDLMHRQQIEVLLDLVNREKVAAGIEHGPTISKMGLIGDFDRRQFDNTGPFPL